MNLTHIELARS